MNVAAAVKVGIFTVIALILAAMEVGTLNGPDVGTTHTYYALFTQADGVSGLRAGNAVEVSGVAVGKVQSTDLLNAATVRVTFTANDDQTLTTSTWAIVRYANLIGTRYLALTQSGRAGRPLKPGATIPATRTQPALSLTALFNGFRPLFSALTPQHVNELAADVIDILQGQTGKLDDLINRTADLTSTLATRDKVFGEVVDSVAALLKTVSEHDDQLASVVTTLNALTSELHADGPALLGSLDSVDGLIGSAGDLLQGLESHSLPQDVADAEAISGVLARNTSTLAKLIVSFDVAFGDFSRVTQNGNFINAFLCDTSFATEGRTTTTPAQLISSMANSLPGGLGQLVNQLGLSSVALLQLQVHTPLKLPVGFAGQHTYTQVCR